MRSRLTNDCRFALAVTQENGYAWIRGRITGEPFQMLNSSIKPMWRFAVPLCLVVVLAGCASSEKVVPVPPRTAHLTILNLSEHAWKVEVRSRSGGPERGAQVPARDTVELTLEGGDYLIEQTLLKKNGEAEATRRLTARFEAGGRYQWPLATLLSPTAELPPGKGDMRRE